MPTNLRKFSGHPVATDIVLPPYNGPFPGISYINRQKLFMAHIRVIGCGVTGLTTAIAVQEAGHQVDIVCRDLPDATVSAVAAAIWFPFSAEPKERVNAWSKTTFFAFQQLAKYPTKTGVFMTDFLVYIEDPDYVYWESALPAGIVRPAEPDLIPEHYHSAYYARVPLSDSAVYMPYLLDRFRKNGGQIEQREVLDLEEEAEQADWLINCSGLGARTLCRDESLYPIRGQVVRLSKPKTTLRTLIDEYMPHRLAYVLPRTHDVIIGGTAVAHDASTTENPEETRQIRDLCTKILPEINDLSVLEVKVGHRPGRPQVRLESEAGKRIIHNYGHGGSGYTVSWGCAFEVRDLLA